MRRPLAIGGLAFVAFGLGVLVNASAIAAFIGGGIGLVLLIVSLFAKPAGITDATPPAMVDGAGRPTLAGLGTRVERILAQAERQAADHVATARRQADRIIADAQRKASNID